MSIRRGRFFHLTLLLTLVTVVCLRGAGQDLVQLKRKGDAKDDEKSKKIAAMLAGKLEKSKLLEEQKVLFKCYMVARINDMKLRCKLSDSQTKRLDLAAKGAIRKFTVKWKQGAVEWLLDFAGLRNFGGQNEKQIEQMADQFLNNAMFQQFNILTGASFCSDVIAKEKIWQNAIEKTLTKEQRKTYDDYRKKLRDDADNQSIETIMQSLTGDLLLSDEQAGKFRPLIAKVMADTPWTLRTHKLYGGMIMTATTYELDDDVVKKVLDENQMIIWNDRKKTFGQVGNIKEEMKRILGPWGALTGDKALGAKGDKDSKVEVTETVTEDKAEPDPPKKK